MPRQMDEEILKGLGVQAVWENDQTPMDFLRKNREVLLQLYEFADKDILFLVQVASGWFPGAQVNTFNAALVLLEEELIHLQTEADKILEELTPILQAVLLKSLDEQPKETDKEILLRMIYTSLSFPFQDLISQANSPSPPAE